MLLLIIIFGTAILIWLSVLTYFFVKFNKSYKNLLLNGVEGLSRQQIADINKDIAILRKGELEHIQKIGFVRFNPFNETGGDNSFTLALLNGNSNGVVLTGLHTREKTRVYAKEINKGESKQELSNEEKLALKKALN